MGNALLLSREFIHILMIAIAIAAPLSYTLNTMWLRKFPNRVEFGWGTVLLGTGIILALGLLTIASQTIRASRLNPVESLRAD
jgi:putative ABC transport system permease protein